MFAIIETGGKQVKAEPGRNVDIEKITKNKGEKVKLSNVLMLVNGKESKVGNPFIKGAVINGQIVEQGKGDKVIVYKMRPKKGTRKKYGHRQHYSRVYIENIELDGKVFATPQERKIKKEVEKQRSKEIEKENETKQETETTIEKEEKSKKKAIKKKEE